MKPTSRETRSGIPIGEDKRGRLKRPGLAGAVAALAVAAMLLGYGSAFTVYQTHQALVVRLGDPLRTITEPGLHFLQQPLKFYQTVGTIQGLNSQLSTLLTSALRRVLGEASFVQVVRDERAQLMTQMREQLDREAVAFGVSIVDVRVTHVNLPEPNSLAVYRRMQTERQRIGAQFRAEGAQRAQEIRAAADREVTELIAQATSEAEQVRGEGDAERNRIFAKAFNRDPEFFAFYRAMQAYEAAMRPSDTRMLLRPDSEFFRYFRNPSGKPRAADER
jgi:membrane protease subunit HflC